MTIQKLSKVLNFLLEKGAWDYCIAAEHDEINVFLDDIKLPLSDLRKLWKLGASHQYKGTSTITFFI